MDLDDERDDEDKRNNNSIYERQEGMLCIPGLAVMRRWKYMTDDLCGVQTTQMVNRNKSDNETS